MALLHKAMVRLMPERKNKLVKKRVIQREHDDLSAIEQRFHQWFLKAGQSQSSGVANETERSH